MRIVVQGPFNAPSIRPELKRAIARSVAAIALGVVAAWDPVEPLASSLGYVEKSLIYAAYVSTGSELLFVLQEMSSAAPVIKPGPSLRSQL